MINKKANQDNVESRYEDIKNLFFIVFIVFLMSFFIFIYLWRNVQMANLDFEIERLKKEKKKLHLEVESIHVSITQNTSSEKIEKILAENEIFLPVRTGKKIISVELPEFSPGTMGDVKAMQTGPTGPNGKKEQEK